MTTPFDSQTLVTILREHARFSTGRPGGKRADLHGADLSGLRLTGIDLRQAKLTGANLSRIDLTSSNLCEADLFGANLSGANLTRTNFEGADLRGARFRGAVLKGANLASGQNPVGTAAIDDMLGHAAVVGFVGILHQNQPSLHLDRLSS